MSRHIKSKTVKATISNKDILNTFQDLLGTSDSSVTLHIAWPKYQNLKTHVKKFLDLLSTISESTFMVYFPIDRDNLTDYITSLKKDFETDFSLPDCSAYVVTQNLRGDDFSGVPIEIKEEFAKKYHLLKECNVINTIISTCDKMLPNKKQYENSAALSDIFLTKSAGNVFNPIANLPDFNIKKMYNTSELSASEKNLILLFVSKLYNVSFETYKVLSTPDIDVDEFISVLVGSIDDVKKHIPRCDEAFDKLIESIDILKGNFSNYYKDFMSCNNPTIIMENFVLDVSTNTKYSPKITQQFRKIISHYKDQASKMKINDPKLKTLFQQVDKNFSKLDKHEAKTSGAEASETGVSDSDSSASETDE